MIPMKDKKTKGFIKQEEEQQCLGMMQILDFYGMCHAMVWNCFAIGRVSSGII
jgi:hypothetical protein